MASHTPGPWVEHDINGQKTGIILGQKYATEHICDTGLSFWRNPERCSSQEVREEMTARSLANARLIASAPELLAALERLQLESIHYRDSGVGKQFLDAALDNADAAIRKARGV